MLVPYTLNAERTPNTFLTTHNQPHRICHTTLFTHCQQKLNVRTHKTVVSSHPCCYHLLSTINHHFHSYCYRFSQLLHNNSTQPRGDLLRHWAAIRVMTARSAPSTGPCNWLQRHGARERRAHNPPFPAYGEKQCQSLLHTATHHHNPSTRADTTALHTNTALFNTHAHARTR